MFLGLDVGTTKVAAVVTDGEGRVAADVSLVHGADLPVGSPGRSEQDPEAVVRAARSAVKELPGELRSQVRAVGTTGQMHGVVVLDDKGVTLTPLVTWRDQRCGEEEGFLEDLRERTGHALHTGYGCATLAWLHGRGELPKAATATCTIHDLVVARLCGERRPVTDPTDAASWGLFDARAGEWDAPAVEAAGFPRELLPQVLACGGKAGESNGEWSASLGIPEGVPVAAAVGDNQASLYATLREPEKELALTLGTGGQLSAVVRRDADLPPASSDSTFEYRPYPGGNVLVVAACLCGGAAWAWLARSVESWLAELELAQPSLDDVYAQLNRLGEKATREVFVSPRFLGERHCPASRGAIEGLDLDPLELGALARGLARGIHRNLREMAPSAVFENRARIVGSGNALRRNGLLRSTAEEVFDLPLSMSEGKEEAAAGAALLASGLSSQGGKA